MHWKYSVFKWIPCIFFCWGVFYFILIVCKKKNVKKNCFRSLFSRKVHQFFLLYLGLSGSYKILAIVPSIATDMARCDVSRRFRDRTDNIRDRCDSYCAPFAKRFRDTDAYYVMIYYFATIDWMIFANGLFLFFFFSFVYHDIILRSCDAIVLSSNGI